MAVVIKTALADSSNYGSKRDTSKIKYLVIHYTANDGDTDEANAKYFQTGGRKASAHYFVDDDSVTQSVKDYYIAWSVGGSKYGDCATTGGGSMYGTITNTNSISIEMCDTIKDGKCGASEKTLANVYWLASTLMKKYNIDINHVYRHFDVTGKKCPAYLVDKNEWNKFKEALNNVYTNGEVSTTTKTGYTGDFPVLPGKGYLTKGDSGVQVKSLQKFLNWYGGYRLTEDGSYGKNTFNAVIDFQKKEIGEDKADGVFGRISLSTAKNVKK